MKILMTGMAARGIGSTKVRHKIVSLPDVLARELRDMGHEVDGPRRVPEAMDPGAAFLDHDVVLVQLGWVSSLSSTYAHEAGMVMARAEAAGVRVVRYVDDWRSQWLADDIAHHVLSERGWSKHVERFRHDVYADIPHGARDAIRSALLRPIQDAPLLVPIMGWGDHEKFDVSTKARLHEVVPFDPQRITDYHATTWADDSARQRRWVVASLQDHDRWVERQGLGWPVLRLGANPKLLGGVPVRGQKNLVIPEEQVCQHYAESWGVLSPEYNSAGSGYWRTRWMQAMEAGAILWPGERDALAFGEPLAASDGSWVLTPAAVESLSEGQLRDMAAAFGDRVWETSWPVELVRDTLERALREGR